MKYFVLLIALASTVDSAHAYTNVWIDGQTSNILPGASYSEYVENTIITLTDDEALHFPGTLNAAFGSSSSYGALRAYANMDTTGVTPGITLEAWSRAQSFDWITVSGSGPVTLQFSMPTSGSFAVGSWDALGSASRDIYTLNDPLLYLSYRARMNDGLITVEQDNQTGTVTVDPNTRIAIHGYLVTRARLAWQPSLALASGADFSHTSEAFIQVLTPGGSVISDSGHNYAPVPEPASVTTLLLGLGLIAARKRRAS